MTVQSAAQAAVARKRAETQAQGDLAAPFDLTESQRLFARSKFRFPAFVGGFGSGKTFAGVTRAISLKSQCIGQDIAYYLPTYPLVRDIAFPRFSELLDQFKIRHTLNKTAAYIDIPDYKGQIKFRTMDSPERIVGYEVAHSILDELDTLPTAKANDVWIKVLARNRQKCAIGNTIAVATTPEGFRFVWQRWVRDATPDYRIYRARTMDNPNLPDGYVDSLRNSYPQNLLSAYLDGEFVNLTSGSVYTNYDRGLNHTNDVVGKGDVLHVGMDFNVTKMAAVIHVLRNGKPRAVAERVNVFDTPDMIALLKRDFPEHQIFVYPDASGGNRKSVSASQSDLSLLRQAKFHVCVNLSNPAVKDRILSMNQMLGQREYLVNPDTCPSYVEGLEKQAYTANGEPDKTAGFDHAIDAGGYFITYKFPVVRRTAQTTQLKM